MLPKAPTAGIGLALSVRTKRWLGLIATGALAAAFSVLFWALTYWQRYFIDSLEDRRIDNFVFAIKLAMVFLLVGAILSFVKEWWLVHWINIRRELRFRDLGSLYFSGATIALLESTVPESNTVQRLVDDVREWAKDLVELQCSGIGSAISAGLLGFTLWGIIPEIHIAGFTIYGPMFWFSILLFSATSSVLHGIGRSMPERESRRANSEGRFREEMARISEYSRSISLQQGGERERGATLKMLAAACGATAHLAMLRARISAASFLLSPYELFAWLALSTFFFRGELSLGQVFQGTMVHAAMGSALGWLYSHYGDIARVRAANMRLNAWRQNTVDLVEDSITDLRRETADVLCVKELKIFVPDKGEPRGRTVDIPDFLVHPGESVLLRAPSGFGKSLLFSVAAGVWPWASGSVSVPNGALWIPQRPFFPQADLVQAVSYPGVPMFDIRELALGLERVNLSHLLAFGSEVIDWNNTLSGGELSRLAIVRAVLQRPRWLFLDEATAALDAAAAKVCWTWLHEIENMTIVAISHQPVNSTKWSRVIDLTTGAVTPRLRDVATGSGDDARHRRNTAQAESGAVPYV